MKILYKNKTAEKQFCSKYIKDWRYPEQVKRKLVAAENAFLSATTLHDIAVLPPYHLHPLIGDRKTEWSIYLGNTGFRVTLIPCNENGEEIVSGDILSQCKMIKVVKVTEVSNHYE